MIDLDSLERKLLLGLKFHFCYDLRSIKERFVTGDGGPVREYNNICLPFYFLRFLYDSGLIKKLLYHRISARATINRRVKNNRKIVSRFYAMRPVKAKNIWRTATNSKFVSVEWCLNKKTIRLRWSISSDETDGATKMKSFIVVSIVSGLKASSVCLCYREKDA